MNNIILSQIFSTILHVKEAKSPWHYPFKVSVTLQQHFIIVLDFGLLVQKKREKFDVCQKL